MIGVQSAWVCVCINDEGDRPLIESTFGPFTKDEAQQFMKQFNEEYDGSPWRVIVRPMIKMTK
jgi:hypothetical protein